MRPSTLLALPLRPSTVRSVLEATAAYPEGVSRLALAEETGLSPATISRAVPLLVRAGLLRILRTNGSEQRFAPSDDCAFRLFAVSQDGLFALRVAPNGAVLHQDVRPYNAALSVQANLDLLFARTHRLELAQRDRLFRSRKGVLHLTRTVRWPRRVGNSSPETADACRKELRRSLLGTYAFLPTATGTDRVGIRTPEEWSATRQALARQNVKLSVLPHNDDPRAFLQSQAPALWQALLRALSPPRR
jgi:hypothetical protein